VKTPLNKINPPLLGRIVHALLRHKITLAHPPRQFG